MAAPSNGVGKPPIPPSFQPTLLRSQPAELKKIYQPSSRASPQNPPPKAASEVKDKQAKADIDSDDFKMDPKLLEDSQSAYQFAMETLAMLSKSYSKKS